VQTRRGFLKTTMMAGAGLAAHGLLRPRTARAFYQSNATPLWRTNLRGVGPGGIPVAAPDPHQLVPGVTTYHFDIRQFTDQVHPTLGPTTFWGYNPVHALGGGTQPQRHLGGIIVAQRGQPIQATFTNDLPSTHIIPVDTSILGDVKTQNRSAVHLHGGLVPWNSDGGPFAWFAPAGSDAPIFGPSFANGNDIDGQAVYYWPMDQSARMLWFHDHAFGITRVNAYAGIASAVLLRDSFEGDLRNQGLPDYIENGGRELPIVVQDKTFVGPDIKTVDPTWPGPDASGSLWYAHVYDTALYDKLGPTPAGPPPPVSCVPEFFGDTMLANGTVYPEVTVEARRYRLRILNACNARFLNLQMYVDDGSANGITLDHKGNPLNAAARNGAALNPQGKPTSNFLVLGTEGGFLPHPAFVPSNIPFNGTTAGGSLLLAPAERVDVLFDFSLHADKNIVLYTDAPAPFPTGDPLNDYFPGLGNKNPTNAVTPPGSGPNTRIIMRFNVVAPKSADAPVAISRASDFTSFNEPLLHPLGNTTPPQINRVLTLNEAFDQHGRLIQYLGSNFTSAVTGGYGLPYESAPTETARYGDTELWQIVNLTGDTHPIHFHLVNVQIISRQAFNAFKGTPNLRGAPFPPAPYEQGWKETVRMNPGEVTTVIMKFVKPAVPFVIPESPRFKGYDEYVWHCHILEHEEHDMMRPLILS
jgi:spore coat protein A, manganese oxidase